MIWGTGKGSRAGYLRGLSANSPTSVCDHTGLVVKAFVLQWQRQKAGQSNRPVSTADAVRVFFVNFLEGLVVSLTNESAARDCQTFSMNDLRLHAMIIWRTAIFLLITKSISSIDFLTYEFIGSIDQRRVCLIASSKRVVNLVTVSLSLASIVSNQHIQCSFNTLSRIKMHDGLR